MRNYLRFAFRYPRYVGYGMIHYFASSLGQTFLIAIFVPFFVESLALTNSEFSFIYAAATLTSAAFLPFIGSWIDRTKLRKASLVNAAGLVLFCLIAAFSFNIPLLFLALLGLRFFGQGMSTLIGGTAVSRYFEADRGKALSISTLGLPVAEALLPFTLVLFIDSYSWEMAFLALAGFIILVFTPLVIRLVDKNNPFQQMPHDSGNADKTLSGKEVLRDINFYLILPSMIFMPFFVTGVFIHQNLIADFKGWSMEWMAVCFTGYGVARIVTNLLAGPLIDQFSARKTYLFHLIPLALGLMLLYAGRHPYIAMIYMILIGITTSFKALSGTALWAEIYGVRHLGAIKSMSSTLMVFSTALGPVVIGWGMAHSMEATTLVSIAAIAFVSALALVALKRMDKQKNAYAVK